MKIISCKNCAIILDGDVLRFPDDCYDDDGCIDDTKAIWDNRDYHPFVKCPVCGKPIISEERV